MMRTCKKVLRCTQKYYKRGYPDFYEIAKKAGMHPSDVMGACKVLVDQGYMEYTYPVVDGVTCTAPAGCSLTLKGRNPVEYFESQAKAYMKEKWIDILALSIATISLIISIIALISRSD